MDSFEDAISVVSGILESPDDTMLTVDLILFPLAWILVLVQSGTAAQEGGQPASVVTTVVD